MLPGETAVINFFFNEYYYVLEVTGPFKTCGQLNSGDAIKH